MAVPLSIALKVSGEAIADDYRYVPSMSIFGTAAATLPSSSSTDANDRKASTVPAQLFVPYLFRITRGDVVKGGEFADPKKVTTSDLLRVLGTKQSVARVIDYAQARLGATSGETIAEAEKSGALLANIELILGLAFKNNAVLRLQGQDYTVYSSKLDSWKVVPKTRRDSERVSVVVSIGVAKGQSIGVVKKMRISCPAKRAALRESVKAVLGKDLLGEPSRRAMKVVPRRLVSPVKSPYSSSRASSRRRSYLSQDDARRLRRLFQRSPDDRRRRSSVGRTDTRSSSPVRQYTPTSSSSSSRPSRGGRRTRGSRKKATKNQRYTRRRNHTR